MKNIQEFLNTDLNKDVKTYKKGTILQQAGDTVLKSMYVKKGLLRSYTIDSKGKEHIFMFAPEGWIISDIESFTLETAAVLYIDCIEDSEVVLIDGKSQISNLLTIEQYAKTTKLLFKRIATLQKRLILMMSASARTRYEYFLETYPDLPNRISQRMIASFLGITPEALSKIRREIVKGK